MKKTIVLLVIASLCFCVVSASAEELIPQDLSEQALLIEANPSEGSVSEGSVSEGSVSEESPSEELSSEELTPEGLMSEELTSEELTSEELSSDEAIPEDSLIMTGEEDDPDADLSKDIFSEDIFSEDSSEDDPAEENAEELSPEVLIEDTFVEEISFEDLTVDPAEDIPAEGYDEPEAEEVLPEEPATSITIEENIETEETLPIEEEFPVLEIVFTDTEEVQDIDSLQAGSLSIGMVSTDVYKLQQLLHYIGYYEYEPDGDFGTYTDSCVRRFQKDNGLYVDGIVGTITWNALLTKASNASSGRKTTELYEGVTGSDVSELQSLLAKIGYYDYEPDGDFGPYTTACVKRFQADFDLYVDGIVGPLTLNTLKKAVESISSTLTVGMKGTAVKELQTMLYNLGYYELLPDGDFGAYTDACVRRFQEDYGLYVDGVAGPYTQNVLRSKIAPVLLHNITKELKKGMTGDEVANLQNKLALLGYPVYPDGDYGALTASAVRQFQLLNGLSLTGSADAATIRVLNSKNAARYSSVYLGDDSASIAAFQQILYDLGYLTIAPDGDFGYYTKQALKFFQLANGLVADGVLNDVTISRLVNNPVAYSSSLPLKRSNKLTVENYGEDCGRLLITWTEVPGADGYYLYRSTTENGDYRIINITETACKYIDWGLDPGGTYFYFVMAYTGHPLEDPSDKQYIALSNTAFATTPVYEEHYEFTDAYVTPYFGNTVSTDEATDTAAKEIYKKLETGENFYLFVRGEDSAHAYSVFYGLKNKISNMSDPGVGFVSINTYYSNGGYYFLIDAETYYWVKKYITMAYTERMEEYGIYLANNGSDEYFYDHHDETSYDVKYIASYRDSLFETEYGTHFNDMSTESKLLFVTPGTNMVVRTDYMIFDLDINTVGETAIDLIMKAANKSALACCRHFSLTVKTLCEYLDIPCWNPVDYAYNHQWSIVQTYSNEGDVVWYLVDNQNVVRLDSDYPLTHRPVNTMIWDYSPATIEEMGEDYPF